METGDGNVKASVSTFVTKARLMVEVEGTAAEISDVFDGVLASVAKHFPNADIEVGAGPETQHVDAPGGDRTQHVVGGRRKAA
jgi:hypothetical protein